MGKTQKESVKPFLKWPGGKRWMAEYLSSEVSKRLNGCYFEPFLGGAASFFYLNPRHAFLTDINDDLINAYRVVRDNPTKIIQKLKKMEVTKENYYKIRASKPEKKINKAARFLYLNRTAFGGIYRVNSKGEFNVPYGGGRRTPEILWRRELIHNCSKLLKNKIILSADFEEVMSLSSKGDVIYCDPTYTVAHENNGFLKYNEKIFSWSDQKRLALSAKKAYKRGVTVFISNAAHESILELYDPFEPIKLERMSLVSAKKSGRKKVNEYLFILDPKEKK